MRPVLLINPNTSRATTGMMVALASETAGPGVPVTGATADAGPAMITTPEALDAAEAEVVRIGLRDGPASAGVIVGAFGDPGAARLRALLAVPVVGLCEAAMAEAAFGGRRFGVATTTPALAGRIDAAAGRLGLGARYAGTRLTEGDPVEIARDPHRLEEALAAAVEALVARDGAEAVIIGGGPLSRAAAALSARLRVPVIAPVAAAMRSLMAQIQPSPASPS